MIVFVVRHDNPKQIIELIPFWFSSKGKSEDEEHALIRALSCVDSGTTIRWFVQRLLWIETIRNQGWFLWRKMVSKIFF
jgi:hypothetical protein